MKDNKEKLDMFLEDERLDPLYRDLVPEAPDFVESSVRRIKAMKRTRIRRVISSVGGIAAVLLVFAAVKAAPYVFGGTKNSAANDEMPVPAANYSVSKDDIVKEAVPMAPEEESSNSEGTTICAPEPSKFFSGEKNAKGEQEEIPEVYLFEEDDWNELYDLIIKDHKADNVIAYMETEDGIGIQGYLSGKEKLLEMISSENLRDILGRIESDSFMVYFK